MRNVIKCPHCQAEYMAAEIFLPDSFLGHPNAVFVEMQVPRKEKTKEKQKEKQNMKQKEN